jgi:hypothetical protein
MDTELKIIAVRAWRTDEGFGYDRWKADQYSLGRGTHDAVLIFPSEGESREELTRRVKAALGL